MKSGPRKHSRTPPPLSPEGRGARREPLRGSRSRGSTLLGVFIGLLVGVLLSFGVVWYMNQAPLPFRDKAMRTDRPGAEPETPAPLPGKPGDKVSEKPRFEFYKILPGSQDANPANSAASGKPEAGKIASAEPLYLQAGSFQSATDADNLKAKLALMGVDAGVQEVDLPEKGKMHRVRVGPLSSVDEMNRVRALLSQNGIQAAPAKGKN
jgi:cell division protein FtsN